MTGLHAYDKLHGMRCLFYSLFVYVALVVHLTGCGLQVSNEADESTLQAVDQCLESGGEWVIVPSSSAASTDEYCDHSGNSVAIEADCAACHGTIFVTNGELHCQCDTL